VTQASQSNRKGPHRGFAILELLLVLAIIALVLQLIPGLQDRLLGAVDFRTWSRASWIVANLALFLALLWLRFGPAIWYTLAVLTKRLTSKRSGILPADSPAAPKLSEYYFKPRQDVRKLLREEEARRFMEKKRFVIRSILIVAVVGCLGAVAWARIGGKSAEVADFEPLFRNHPGELLGGPGIMGGVFQVRDDKDVRVTHMGIFDSGEDGMHLVHRVGLWEVAGQELGKGKMIAQVRVPVGKSAMLRDGYRWMPLAKPVVLKAGGQFILCCEVYDGGADLWPDCFRSEAEDPAVPEWNAYFTGLQGSETRRPLTRDTQPWPYPPTKDIGSAVDTVIGVVNIADMRSVPDPPPEPAAPAKP
jgi:prepilin-type N-terminal cleavage/methylation domain-containing protein